LEGHKVADWGGVGEEIAPMGEIGSKTCISGSVGWKKKEKKGGHERKKKLGLKTCTAYRKRIGALREKGSRAAVEKKDVNLSARSERFYDRRGGLPGESN